MLLVIEQPLLGGVGLEAVHQPVWAAQRWGCASRRSRRRTHKAETLPRESGVMVVRAGLGWCGLDDIETVTLARSDW
jgi:hypothetical protein